MNLTGPGLTADDHHAALYGEQREPVAPFCPGPGHLLDTDEQGFTVRLEDCPTCAHGPVRNHTAFRSPSPDCDRLRAERDDLDRRLSEAIEALRPLSSQVDISPVLRAMEVLR